MPERVGEGFLNYAIAGELEARGELAHRSPDLETDGQSSFLDRLDDGAHVGQSRLRISIIADDPQNSEDRSQLLHCPPSSFPDSVESPNCAIRRLFNHLACSSSLDDHQAHAVSNDVVQFPSDAGALLRLSDRKR